jgi:hypothetical protein
MEPIGVFSPRPSKRNPPDFCLFQEEAVYKQYWNVYKSNLVGWHFLSWTMSGFAMLGWRNKRGGLPVADDPLHPNSVLRHHFCLSARGVRQISLLADPEKILSNLRPHGFFPWSGKRPTVSHVSHVSPRALTAVNRAGIVALLTESLISKSGDLQCERGSVPSRLPSCSVASL